MNQIHLTGHIGRDAVRRDVTTQSGPKPVVNFSLAVKVGYGTHEKTLWYDCAWWGERAAKLTGYLLTGTRILVTGSPDIRTFAKKDGTTGAAITVSITDLEFIGTKQENSTGPATAAAPTPAPTPTPTADPEGDIPF